MVPDLAPEASERVVDNPACIGSKEPRVSIDLCNNRSVIQSVADILDTVGLQHLVLPTELRPRLLDLLAALDLPFRPQVLALLSLPFVRVCAVQVNTVVGHEL